MPNDPQDFAFTGDIPGCTIPSLDDDADPTLSNSFTCSNIAIGPYTVTETAVTGWDLSSISCNDANSTGDTTTGIATIHLEAGESVICTFTNVKRTPVTIVKHSAASDPQDFTFTTNNPRLHDRTLSTTTRTQPCPTRQPAPRCRASTPVTEALVPRLGASLRSVVGSPTTTAAATLARALQR